jgi:hypothetical protein
MPWIVLAIFVVARLLAVLTPTQRSMRARIAANTRWSRDGERKANAERAQRGLLAKFEAEVDPGGVLPEAERLRRAKAARRAHMQRLQFLSSRSRTRTTGTAA